MEWEGCWMKKKMMIQSCRVIRKSIERTTRPLMVIFSEKPPFYVIYNPFLFIYLDTIIGMWLGYKITRLLFLPSPSSSSSSSDYSVDE